MNISEQENEEKIGCCRKLMNSIFNYCCCCCSKCCSKKQKSIPNIEQKSVSIIQPIQNQPKSIQDPILQPNTNIEQKPSSNNVQKPKIELKIDNKMDKENEKIEENESDQTGKF